jgi:hypothetical protein
MPYSYICNKYIYIYINICIYIYAYIYILLYVCINSSVRYISIYYLILHFSLFTVRKSFSTLNVLSCLVKYRPNYIYIYIYIHIYLCTYIHMHIRIYIHRYLYAYIYMYIFIHMYIHTYMYTYIICTYLHTYMYIYIICTYLHTYMYTCIICTYSYIPNSLISATKTLIRSSFSLSRTLRVCELLLIADNWTYRVYV